MDLLHKVGYKFVEKDRARTNEELRWKTFIKMNASAFSKKYDGGLPVAMVYTGGTTGISKAVKLTSHNFNCAAYQCVNSGMDYKRRALFLDTLPPFIAYGLTVGFHLPLSTGIRIRLEPDSTMSKTGEKFAKHKPEYYAAGAFQIDNIISTISI